MTVKRWHRVRRNQWLILMFILGCLCYYVFIYNQTPQEPSLDITRRYIERKLQQSLKFDKGSGCEIPKLDPFSPEVTQFDKYLPKVVCDGTDWVECYLSECRVRQDILSSMQKVECEYRDVVYESDMRYVVGSPVVVAGAGVYKLAGSDHAKVKCSAISTDSKPSQWSGLVIGFRTEVSRPPPPAGRERTYNVLIVGFDSTSKNGFIRRMPKSYEYLKNQLKATILDGYNTVGDGTPAALFPILTGKTELELPESRRSIRGSGYLDVMPFIFYKLKDDGYRTAYFEDSPQIGTFQYRFNGFKKMPADHYLRPFFLENNKIKSKAQKYCVGARPSYRMMLDVTEQFMKLDGKRFIFTFIADITHDEFNMISTADEEFAQFLARYAASGAQEDTLLLVMGDHGPRYANVRDTFQGKLEERLPLMALVLPSQLRSRRPGAQPALQHNAAVLTTPHDIHATILDALDLRHLWNPYAVTGADLPRGLTLLDPVPRNRSCSEAGIEPHWCACLRWAAVPRADPQHARAAQALLDHLNKITEEERARCEPRSLLSVEWVLRQRANKGVMAFETARDVDGYVGKFGNRPVAQLRETYQAKIVVGPGKGAYEASLTYNTKEDKFLIDTREISRTNAYNNEPSCISDTKPHLNMFCYCKEYLS